MGAHRVGVFPAAGQRSAGDVPAIIPTAQEPVLVFDYEFFKGPSDEGGAQDFQTGGRGQYGPGTEALVQSTVGG